MAPPAAAPAPAAGPTQRRHRVLMVSDFFYPNFGGVETHIYQLAQCLLAAGHKVVVLTHAYGDCGGVRYLTNGLKVYYLYRRPIHAQSTLPTWVGAFRLLRLVCLRERITLVHCHQAFSTLGGEALLQARAMGYPVVFTDHSLFGFADAPSILTNKLIKGVLADVQHVICVSHTSKENTVLRACLHPAAVSVIPNAVDASEFQPPGLSAPAVSARGGGRAGALCAATPQQERHQKQQQQPPAASRGDSSITIVALSRLVYRKGVDILALVIPEVCHRHPRVNFVIGGDGPKAKLLAQMVESEGLAGRVTLAGAIPHEHARDFLAQGDIFINASLTEAFCIAIVEAASVGLVVVSTSVGGVPEVLPPDMMLLAEPSPDALLAAVEEAITRVPTLDRQQQHERMSRMYNWPSVAARTAAVYDRLAAGCTPAADPRRQLLPRLRRYRAVGAWAGLVLCCIVLWLHWFWLLLEWQQPAADVDVAPDWPQQQQWVEQQAGVEAAMGAPPPQQQQQQEQEPGSRHVGRYSLRSRRPAPTAPLK